MSEKSGRIAVIASLALSAGLALVGVFVLTDVGQMLGVGKTTVVVYFQNHVLLMALSVALFLIAAFVNRRLDFLRGWTLVAFGAFLIGCFLVTKYAVPYVVFAAKQDTAVYEPIAEVEGYLRPDDVVYVVSHNGVTRAYPKKYIWISHVFGGDFGGEEIVLTYCVLTNLPVPYRNDLDGEELDLRVLAQTNNNLLLWDTNSGEIIQQITSTCEFSKRRLEPLPVLEMTWSSYQDLFPSGEVLFNEYTNPVERILELVMPPVEAVHSGEDWMFPTVDLEDDRLPSKEQVIGLADGGEAVAYTRAYLRKHRVVNTRVGAKSVVIAHIPEHDIFVAFDRRVEGEEVEITEVDLFGNSAEHGTLEPVFLYNGPMWAVWVHYHPDTKLSK